MNWDATVKINALAGIDQSHLRNIGKYEPEKDTPFLNAIDVLKKDNERLRASWPAINS